MERDALATLPNLLSLSRLALAGVFVVCRTAEGRLACVVAAAATDFLDGYVARTRGSATRWGALIDPIADRFFVFAAVCTLLFTHVIAPWQYAVFITRDFMTAVGFLTARALPMLRAIPFQARPSGKVVTVLQLATLAVVYIAPRWVNPLLGLVGLASLYAIGDYTRMLWNQRARS